MGAIGSSARFRAAFFFPGAFRPDRCGAGELLALAPALRGLIGFFDIFLALSLKSANHPLN
ncbi:MAG: hypothetical protein K2Y39_11230 [Candidatus Obscuribacterales bacterium]|nr:hypothetical protein [Candidatus Obscuribacterales bacterium]